MENGKKCKAKILKLNPFWNLKNKVIKSERYRKKISPKKIKAFLRLRLLDIDLI
jgi:hypothetical protein